MGVSPHEDGITIYSGTCQYFDTLFSFPQVISRILSLYFIDELGIVCNLQ